jgi:iron complex outermembrane receptor protein
MKTCLCTTTRAFTAHSRYAPLALAVLVSTSLAPSAFAQDAVDEEPEVIVTAPLEGSRIESLQGATSLNREEVVATLNGGLGNSLDAQPGIATTFFGAGASRPIIRGLGEDRVRVLQNGIGAIDVSTASPDHAVTSEGLDAERIEILRGAAALAYGGNAVGGVVNVIDQSIPTRAIEGVEAQGLGAYSSVDEGRQGALDLGAGAGPFAFRLSAAARETENYDTPIGETLNTWTEVLTYGAGGSVLGDWGFVGLAVKRTEDQYGLLPEDPAELDGRIELEQTRVELRGDFRIDAGPFDAIDFGAQHSDYQHTEFEGDGGQGTQFFSEGWEARLEAHHRGERLRGALGLQATDVDLDAVGDEAFLSPTNTRDLGAFVIERWDLGHWGLEGGARYERREHDNATFGQREFDTVSGSFGAFVRPTPNWFIGATLARTERAPTATELFADGPHLATGNYELGDPALDPEIATSFEISARRETDRFSFEANFFAIDFADYVALVERGDVWWVDEDLDVSGFAPDEASAPAAADEILPVFNFVQQDASFIGGEVSIRARLIEAGSFTISGDAAIDLVNARFAGGGHPPRIPPRSLTLGLEGENAFWTGRIETVSTDNQSRLAPFETPTDGYTFLNASLAFRPGGEEGAWTIRLDGRNLTDELGRVHSSFLKDDLPLPGRNLRLTVLTEF